MTKRKQRTPPLPVGAAFGRLTVVEHLGRTPIGSNVYRSTCTCGESVVVLHPNLLSGYTTSCGCAKSRGGVAPKKPRPPGYGSWASAKRRCTAVEDKDYPRYGGRGIEFYPQWLNDFAAFAAYMGPRPPGTTLDRIDNALGYVPGNVRWADSRVQALNRGSIRWVEVDGVLMSAAEAAAKIGITTASAYKRLAKTGSIYGDPRSNRKGKDQAVVESPRDLVLHTNRIGVRG